MYEAQNCYNRTSFLYVYLLLLIIAGCSNSYSGKADIGANSIAKPGIPHITVTTSSNVNDQGQTQGVLYLAITENSLIFKKFGNELVNRSTLTVQITPKNDSNSITENYPLRFIRDEAAKYYERNTIIRRKVFGLPPGEYSLQIAITDEFSGKQSVVKNKLKIPDPNSENVFISNVRFFEKPSFNANYIAVNKYHVNSGYDSLKFSFQVTNGIESEILEIKSSLKRFRADTEPARPMSGREIRKSSLIYKGLDYSSSETIQSNLRNLGSSGSVTIENTFGELPMGNYRFEVETRTSEDTFYEVRDFSIKSPNFPQVKTSRELALPLKYLMDRDSYYEILQIQDEEVLKKAIDAFWLKNIQNVPKAKNIIKLYYERVEQANIQFSNYKEGWKTDMGMVFILFGPPLYTDTGFGEMTWFYEFDSGNRTPSIQFEDSRYGNIKFPFENQILNRSQDFFNLEYRQIQSWLDGSILYLSQ